MPLSDEEKRMLSVLFCLNKTVEPILQDYVKEGMDNHYTSLDGQLKALTPPCSLSTLTYNILTSSSSDPRLKTITSSLKFGNINRNSDVHKGDKTMYDYKVSSSVDLAKLYLPNYLAQFSAFDTSVDMSAILRLLGEKRLASIFFSSNPFLCIQTTADDVRSNVRNKTAHFDPCVWNETFFEECFTKMEDLVKSIVLPDALESTKLDELSTWKKKGKKTEGK